MDYYDIETAKGIVRCSEMKGIYYPVREEDVGFMFEPILSIEIVRENEDAGI